MNVPKAQKKTYKLTITMKSGVQIKVKVHEFERDLDSIIKLMDAGFKDLNTDGWVGLARHYIAIREISHYYIKRCNWFGF